VNGLERAFESLVDRLPAVGWTALALALAIHVARLIVRSRAWRNVIAAAYPAGDVRWRSVFGGYVAGVGVNALVPARGGDLLKLYLVRRSVPGSSYPTLAATLVVETIVDFFVALLFVSWALAVGKLPGRDAIARLPSIDWLWVFHEPRIGAILAALALVLGFALGIWAGREGRSLRARLAQGVAILHQPGRYVRSVVLWQLADWTLRLAAIAFFLEAFGLPVTGENVALVQTTHSLSTLLPLTPSGIGTEQALLVYVLSGEASASAILSFSVGMRLALAAVNVALAALVLVVVLRTLRWRRVVAEDAA